MGKGLRGEESAPRTLPWGEPAFHPLAGFDSEEDLMTEDNSISLLNFAHA